MPIGVRRIADLPDPVAQPLCTERGQHVLAAAGGTKNLGAEMERMCSQGTLTPDEWMRQAVGSPISAGPFIDAASEATMERPAEVRVMARPP